MGRSSLRRRGHGTRAQDLASCAVGARPRSQKFSSAPTAPATSGPRHLRFVATDTSRTRRRVSIGTAVYSDAKATAGLRTSSHGPREPAPGALAARVYAAKRQAHMVSRRTFCAREYAETPRSSRDLQMDPSANTSSRGDFRSAAATYCKCDSAFLDLYTLVRFAAARLRKGRPISGAHRLALFCTRGRRVDVRRASSFNRARTPPHPRPKSCAAAALLYSGRRSGAPHRRGRASRGTFRRVRPNRIRSRGRGGFDHHPARSRRSDEGLRLHGLPLIATSRNLAA